MSAISTVENLMKMENAILFDQMVVLILRRLTFVRRRHASIIDRSQKTAWRHMRAPVLPVARVHLREAGEQHSRLSVCIIENVV